MQADLSFCWAQLSEGMFSSVTVIFFFFFFCLHHEKAHPIV